MAASSTAPSWPFTPPAWAGPRSMSGSIPAASVTKVMTALVVLKDKPLKKGEAGPAVTITDADVRGYQADLQAGQSVARVEAGEQLTVAKALGATLPFPLVGSVRLADASRMVATGPAATWARSKT